MLRFKVHLKRNRIGAKMKNLDKLLTTIALISKTGGATAQEIADKLGVTREKTYDWLRKIKEYGFEIEKKRDENNKIRNILIKHTGKWSDLFNSSGITFSRDELVALGLLKNGLQTYHGNEIKKITHDLFKKINKAVSMDLDGKINDLNFFFPAYARLNKNYKGKEQIIDILVKAIQERHKCLITYSAFHDGKTKDHVISPLHLFEHQGGLYLFVHIDPFDNIRTLALERISQITESEEIFIRPTLKEFDPELRMKNVFGLICDDSGPIEVKIWFSAHQAPYIKERIWSPSQDIIDQNDGSIILKMKTSGRYEIKRWVLGYGAEAEVLQPNNLREEIADELQQMTKRY